MEIQPKDSTGLLRTYDTFTVPEENITQVTTNMMVRDGHTIVIGGLFRESIKRQRGQVPAIVNLPLIGPLFRNKLDDTLREEVMLLLTPHILHNAEDEILTRELRDRGERIRLGARQGISWFHSRSMTDTLLLKARRHLAGGNIDRALWNVDMALACEPTRHEAIALKNRLRTKASWTREPNYLDTKSLVKRMVLANQDAIDVPVAPRETDHNQKRLEALLKKLEEEKRKRGQLQIPADARTKPAAGSDETKPAAGGEEGRKPADADDGQEAPEAGTEDAGAGSIPPAKAPEPPVLEAPGLPSTIKEDVKIPSGEPDFENEGTAGDSVSSGEEVVDDDKNYYFIIDM
jgi:hypothetical protein